MGSLSLEVSIVGSQSQDSKVPSQGGVSTGPQASPPAAMATLSPASVSQTSVPSGGNRPAATLSPGIGRGVAFERGHVIAATKRSGS